MAGVVVREVEMLQAAASVRRGSYRGAAQEDVSFSGGTDWRPPATPAVALVDTSNAFWRTLAVEDGIEAVRMCLEKLGSLAYQLLSLLSAIGSSTAAGTSAWSTFRISTIASYHGGMTEAPVALTMHAGLGHTCRAVEGRFAVGIPAAAIWAEHWRLDRSKRGCSFVRGPDHHRRWLPS